VVSWDEPKGAEVLILRGADDGNFFSETTGSGKNGNLAADRIKDTPLAESDDFDADMTI
jgi:hypothetical protein